MKECCEKWKEITYGDKLWELENNHCIVCGSKLKEWCECKKRFEAEVFNGVHCIISCGKPIKPPKKIEKLDIYNDDERWDKEVKNKINEIINHL